LPIPSACAPIVEDKTTAAPGIPGWGVPGPDENLHAMQFPIKVIFQGAAARPEVEASVVEAVSQLEDFCDHITACQVFVHAASSDQGLMISLKLWTPHAEITIAGGRPNNHGRRDLRATLHDAFARAYRELSLLELPSCTCKSAAV
jgi:hypothetical protein